MALNLYSRNTDIRYIQYKQLPWVLASIWLFTALIMPGGGNQFDLACCMQWANTIRSMGLAHAYDTGPVENNYLPFAQYGMLLFVTFSGKVLSVTFYKALVWLVDIVAVYMLVRCWGVVKQPLVAAVVLLLNPGFFYNTIIWGQVDGIMAFLVMLSVQQAGEEKASRSAWWFLLAVNFKLQAIIFLPMLGLLWLPIIRHTFTWQNVMRTLLLLLVTQALIFLPFWLAGTLSHGLKAATDAVGYYPLISLNAYNWWHLWMDGSTLITTSDMGKVYGLTYHHWGLLLFCISSALALWPLAKEAYRKWRDREAEGPGPDLVWITAALMPCLFFYFNTQMHERYIHMALLPLMALCLRERRWWWVLVVFSAAYVLGLERVIKAWQLPSYSTLIFHTRFIAVLFGIVMVTFYVRLYRKQPADKPLA